MKTASTVIEIFTAQPQGARAYWQAYPYRNVIGLDVGSGPLWLPGESREYAAEGLIVTPEFAKNLEVFVKHLIDGGEGSCHIHAAMMNDYPNATDIESANNHAAAIIREGRETTLSRLALGQHGVYGWMEGDVAYPVHSVIGLGDHPEVIQVDERGGQLSIAPYRELHAPVGLFIRNTEVQ